MARALITDAHHRAPRRGHRDPHADQPPDGDRLPPRRRRQAAAARHHPPLQLPLRRRAGVQRRAVPGHRGQPLHRLHTVAAASGTLSFSWEGDNGFAQTESRRDHASHERAPRSPARRAAAALACAGASRADTRRSGLRLHEPGHAGHAARRHAEPGHAVGAGRRGAVASRAAGTQRQVLRRLPWRRRPQHARRGRALPGASTQRSARPVDLGAAHQRSAASASRRAGARAREPGAAGAGGLRGACSRAACRSRRRRRPAAGAVPRARRGAATTAHRPARPVVRAMPRRRSPAGAWAAA